MSFNTNTLTKEMEIHSDLRQLLVKCNFSLDNNGINKVEYIDGEIRMANIHNRDKEDQIEDIEEVC